MADKLNMERGELKMSAKNLDKHNRWRNKTVAFRVSPEEDAQIETAVKLTGLTKQDYIIRRLLAGMWWSGATPGSTRRCGTSGRRAGRAAPDRGRAGRKR